jgi:hypothetical protein
MGRSEAETETEEKVMRLFSGIDVWKYADIALRVPGRSSEQMCL